MLLRWFALALLPAILATACYAGPVAAPQPGTAAAYEAALAADDASLAAALTRNIFGKPSDGARRLAAYVREAVRQLAIQHDLSGVDLRFADPEKFAPVSLDESSEHE